MNILFTNSLLGPTRATVDGEPAGQIVEKRNGFDLVDAVGGTIGHTITLSGAIATFRAILENEGRADG